MQTEAHHKALQSGKRCPIVATAVCLLWGFRDYAMVMPRLLVIARLLLRAIDDAGTHT